jgi:serine/threonine protein kinase
MPLSPGTRLGAYEITGLIGAGGMGEVYRARDTRLDRDVAVKILTPEFAQDVERLARFRREAKTLAGINHPHIAHVHGLEESEAGALALVMELVEGEDLAQRLSRGSIPIDEALPIARQIAEALEAAHEQGIVHRDLKPANIKVTPDGTVKVLDFGLAKAIDPVAGSSPNLSPTITSPAMTMRGVILGTAAYMAPEQARGRAVDRRADIWAFGCVLYEMLAGLRAFDGEDITEILGAIVKSDPDWSRLPSSTPPRISALIRRCLQKDLKKRLQHIGDARIEIDEAISAPPETRKTARAAWLPWTVASVMALAAAIALVAQPRVTSQPGNSPNRVVQYEIAMIARNQSTLSPDGRYLAYLQRGAEGRTDLWLRDLGKPSADRLGELTAGSTLVWAPDSLVLFAAEPPSTFRRFDIRTRSSVSQPVSAASASVALGPGGSVMLDDRRIVVGAGAFSPFMTLQFWTPEGITPVLPLDTAHNEVRQSIPARLDADRITFASFRADGTVHLCLTTLINPQPRCAGALNQNSRVYYHDGRIVFSRGGALLARGFDPDRVVFTSDERVIVDGLPLSTNSATRVDVSHTGVIAFPAVEGGETLVWQTAAGQETVLANRVSSSNLALSPDGTRVLTSQAGDLYLLDLKNGGSARLGATSGDPIWAPDGRRLAHRTQAGIVVRSIDDARESVLLPGAALAYPEDWSRDGRWIVVGMRGGATQIEMIAVNGGERVTVLGRDTGLSNADEMHFSPNGKWLAFNAVSGTRHEVFIVPLPPTGQRWQVSSAGGVQARWQPSGRTLSFLDPAGKMMSVEIAEGPAFSAGVPKRLFDVGFGPAAGFDDYRVAPDGRFLVKRPSAQSAVRIIHNWPALLAPQNTP